MNSRVQSVLLDTNKFTLSKAYNWVSTHGFKYHKIDIKKNYFRFRQFNPNTKQKNYRTIELTDGVKAIIEF